MADSSDKRDAQGAAAGSVAEAMNRALAAERQAVAAIEQCRHEAATVLENARHEARAILDHAEQVAHRIYARTDQLAATRARQVAEAVTGTSPEDATSDLAQAVGHLAARMTGGSDA